MKIKLKIISNQMIIKIINKYINKQKIDIIKDKKNYINNQKIINKNNK